jgi:hypothetical protein
MCCVVLFVSACGGGTTSTGNVAAAPSTASSGNGSGDGSGGGGAGGARAFPGAAGKLAQIDGTTLQVQGTDAQTAVTFSASTKFTNTVSAKLSDLVVGVCVQARPARPTSGAGAATPPTAPSPTAAIVAATVEISPAVKGLCTGGDVAGARPPGAGADQVPPAGGPTAGRPQGQGSGGNRFGGFGASGKVVTVTASGFTLERSRPANGTTTAAPSKQTVQTPAATTYTRTGTSNAKALAVGLCVTAFGKADSTGSIAATSIALRAAQNGSCSSGFGGRGPGGRAPAGGGTGA